MEVDDPSRFAQAFKVDSSRKTNWDYTSPGIYFITICAVHHNKFFGKIIDNKMVLSSMGIIANEELLNTFKLRKNILLHEYLIMPNHVHILMEIKRSNQSIGSRDVARYVSTIQSTNVSTTPIKNISTNKNEYVFTTRRPITPEQRQQYSQISPKPNSISSIIRSYKSAVTKRINPKTVFFGWQPRFHDEVIKDKNQFIAVKTYIKNNPNNWHKDEYNK